MKDPIISVDRASKSIACFDLIDCVRPFKSYANEQSAIEEAEAWFKDRTDVIPRIVCPKITNLKLSQ